MRRPAVFFLVVMALGMAMVLAWLGWLTAESNLLGWFLLIVGLAYFFGVIFVFWIRRVQFWQSQGTGDTVGEEASDRSFWLIVVGLVAGFFLPPIEFLLSPLVLLRTDWVEPVGLLVTVLGSFLFIRARRTLGKHYSGHVSLAEGQQLVQHGPYRFVRHPAYAGFILIAVGLALGYSSFVGLAAILLVLLPAIFYRLGVEDRLLAEHFGVQFEEYASRVKRLIPGIW